MNSKKIEKGKIILLEARVKNLSRHFTSGSIQYKNLYGFHNQIFLITSKKNFILRIASASHRSKEDTLNEIDFLLFLKEKGVSVSAPIKGLDGEYVYAINEDQEKWIVSAFEIAKGKDFRSRSYDTDIRFREAGRMLGKIHKYSKIYSPHNLSRSRRQWYESQHMAKASNLFGKYNHKLKVKFDEFMHQMNQLPQTNDSYGLIHGDYLFSNYFFDGDNITVIDFDECEYSWFVYDIAVCMYYYLLGGDPTKLSSKIEEAEKLFYNLLLGYTKENHIDVRWIANINLFFKLREYVLMSTLLERNNESLNGWKKSFFDGALDRQLNDKPFITVDFVKIYEDV